MGKRKRTVTGAEDSGSLVPASCAAPGSVAPSSMGFPFRAGYLQRLSAAVVRTKPHLTAKPTTPEARSVGLPKKMKRDDSSKKMSVPSATESAADIDSSYPETKVFMSTHMSNITTLRAVVCVQPDSVMYISGACSLTLLRGAANINGYKLRIKEKLEMIFAPVWSPAHRLHFSEGKPCKRKETLSALLQQLGAECEFTSAGSASEECVLLLEGYDPESLEWMLAAEDFSKYSSERTSIYGARHTNHVAVHTAVLCDAHSLRLLGIDGMTVPKTWASAATQVTEDAIELRAVVAGAKGVGK